MPSPARAPARPPIIVAASEAERLSALALQMESRAPFAAGLLLAEIERAEVRPDAEIPPGVVTMNATVEFEESARGERRTVQLVYPSEADIAAGKISVLTPMGAGLLGLSPGQAIEWPDARGQARALTVLHVERA